MTTGLKDPCPCGSGKRYKHCHRAIDRQRGTRTSWIALAAVFVVALIAIGVLLGRNRAANAPVATGSSAGNATARTTGTTFPMPGAAASGQAAGNQAPLADGRAPAAWEFDAGANRHWDPAHQHWHDGPPPPESLRPSGGTTASGSSSGPIQMSTTTSKVAPAAQVDQSPLPDGSAPAPNQYDAAKNRYWDAGHKHWHAGQPSATAGTKTTTTVTPATKATGTSATGGH